MSECFMRMATLILACGALDNLTVVDLVAGISCRVSCVAATLDLIIYTYNF